MEMEAPFDGLLTVDGLLTEWFEGDFKDMPEAEFVAWNKALKS